ncbi:MAG: 2-keto-4-pentenoate hydratase/2-oxohepta-3-ene-1,7-dioic acid hydratase in catechol pathway [Verrucomicrobiales bacterium]|jgi:2-keto-4-pentenoate hydratase/2-oxohepta-3-ene-1,7-dioic acid hydratase in catechol pathway
MKFVTFKTASGSGIGALRPDGTVVDLAHDPTLPTDMAALVALGDKGIAAAQVVHDDQAAPVVSDPDLLAPIRPPNNIMAIGKNYHAHALEFSKSGFDASETTAIPQHPIVFTKALSSIIAEGEAIELSSDPSGTSDYEGELAVIIGKGGMNISKADAFDHVYGYTVINDVTAREVQQQHVQFFLGKSAATFGPMGPAIVTADEISDITDAWLRTRVNGELRQESQINLLIFDIPTIIETISRTVRFEPGDVIATGTPAGVGIGFDPPKFLQAGDVVEVDIEGIGTLTNPVVA